jgi:hypothetical protein
LQTRDRPIRMPHPDVTKRIGPVNLRRGNRCAPLPVMQSFPLLPKHILALHSTNYQLHQHTYPHIMSAPIDATVTPVVPAETHSEAPAKALDPIVVQPTFIDKALASAKPVCLVSSNEMHRKHRMSCTDSWAVPRSGQRDDPAICRESAGDDKAVY